MCEIYVKADPIIYEARTRCLRIHGQVTTIRVENEFWDTLAEMARHEDMTTNQLLTKFHDELLVHSGEVNNFASFLRVTCLRYVKLQAETGKDSISAQSQQLHDRSNIANLRRASSLS